MPPEKPLAMLILVEANADLRSGKYTNAAARYEWFHVHALEFSPHLQTIRRTTALTNWHALAMKHPPAMASLRRGQTVAREQVRAGENTVESFLDFEAFNRLLNEPDATLEMFAWLVTEHPESVERVIASVLPTLLKLKAHKMVAQFIRHPENIIREARVKWRLSENMSRAVGRHDSKYEETYANRAATIIALLVHGNRRHEAEKIAADLTRELRSAEFIRRVKIALDGTVPDFPLLNFPKSPPVNSPR